MVLHNAKELKEQYLGEDALQDREKYSLMLQWKAMNVTVDVIMKFLFSPKAPKQNQTANWVSHSASRICNSERS